MYIQLSPGGVAQWSSIRLRNKTSGFESCQGVSFLGKHSIAVVSIELICIVCVICTEKYRLWPAKYMNKYIQSAKRIIWLFLVALFLLSRNYSSALVLCSLSRCRHFWWKSASVDDDRKMMGVATAGQRSISKMSWKRRREWERERPKEGGK
jgi:hypothetical protein